MSHDAALRSREESLLAAEGATAAPSLEMILSLAGRIEDGNHDTVRKLLEILAHSVLLAPRKRVLVIKWRLGGEVEIPISQYREGRGGASRR